MGHLAYPFPRSIFRQKEERNKRRGKKGRTKKRTTSTVVVTRGVVGHCVSSHVRQTRAIDRQTRNRFRDMKRVAHRWHTLDMWVTVAPLWHKSFNGRAGGI